MVGRQLEIWKFETGYEDSSCALQNAGSSSYTKTGVMLAIEEEGILQLINNHGLPAQKNFVLCGWWKLQVKEDDLAFIIEGQRGR